LRVAGRDPGPQPHRQGPSDGAGPAVFAAAVKLVNGLGLGGGPSNFPEEPFVEGAEGWRPWAEG